MQEYSLRKYSEVVRNVLNLVEFNLKKPLSLNLLTRHFNIVLACLSRYFANELGITLMDFINLKRLEHARHLLAGSMSPVDKIAEECSFHDVNYFIRLFKWKYRIPPVSITIPSTL
jgi:transcriptional regulator GlxA family with amidase domain